MNSSLSLLLSFFTVALFYLAFPSGGYGFVAWFALVPVIVSLAKQSQRTAFMIGLLTATLGWMVSIWWVVGGLAQITHSPVNLVIPLVFLFCLFAALPYAIVTWLYNRYQWHCSISGAIKSALLLTVLINFIPHLLPGNLAHALYLQPKQLQLAAIGGVALVFFILHCSNFLLAATVYSYLAQKKFNWRYALCALIIFSANYLYGTYMVKKIDSNVKNNNAHQLTVAMVQPNFPVTWRTRDNWQQHYQQLTTLVAQVAKLPKTELIITPEIPLPISYQKFAFDQHLFEQARDHKALLLTGIDFDGSNLSENIPYFNGIELIQSAQPVQQYHKQFLLPFGEYLPFEENLPVLRRLFPNAPHYQAGERKELLTLKHENYPLKLAPLICYEAVFTDIAANYAQQGSDLFINTVDDAWFGDSAGKEIHFALALFRAIEYRQPLIRVTNNGNSAIIAASGQIIASSIIPSEQQGYAVTRISLANIESFYQKYPNVFMVLSLLLISYFLFKDEMLYRSHIIIKRNYKTKH